MVYRTGLGHDLLGDLSANSVSFTYGDLFPTMRYTDDKPYRKQVYTKDEILDVIQSYGWPQEWNQLGNLGPERYIEVQVWNERMIRPEDHFYWPVEAPFFRCSSEYSPCRVQ